MVVITPDGIESQRPFAPATLALLHLRVRLFRPAGFERRRPQRLRGPQAHRRRARARGAGGRRPRRAGARFRHAGGDRLRRGGGPALRSRHHPQPLCRPHLHRADRRHPPHGREAQAQRQPRRARGQARRAGRRFDRARHDLAEDRADGARRRRRPRCTCGSPARRPTHSCFYGVDTPEQSQAARLAHVDRGDGRRSSRSTASPSSRSTGSTAPSARRERDSDAPQFCDACFTGDYPTRLTDRESGDSSRASSRCFAEVGLTAGDIAGRDASPSSPARRAASAAPRRWRSPRPARMSSRSRAPSAGSRSSTTRSAAQGRRGDAGAARPQGLRRHRPARRRALRALGPARRAARQCRPPRRRHARSPISSRRSGTT